ncbi:MAG: septal ring lytic transglycosylase RlpA family protein [Rickettsiales bacterium]|jgi:rare lipoprotein A|nr:septal ring lytic transglycosylase RlpA family protein [Rickettsiales bacterium]
MKKLLYLLALPVLITACQDGSDFFGTPGTDGSLSETIAEDYAASNITQGVRLQNKDLVYAGPRYYVGDPYKVEDVPYTPAEDYSYSQTGIAGIVPVDLNGTPTTNGEKFDTNAMVATSKVLPLPSIVKITNLDNGQTLVARVNNRGPFVNGRLMDVSPAAARKLGMVGQTNVQVQILKEESQMVRDLTLGVPVTVKQEPAEAPQTRTRATETSASGPTGPYTVQAGAYYSEHSADAVASKLTDIGDVRIVPEGGMFKIQFLDLSPEEARRILDRLKSEGGVDRPGLILNGRWLNPNSI